MFKKKKKAWNTDIENNRKVVGWCNTQKAQID